MNNINNDFALFARDRQVSASVLDGYSKMTNSYINPTIIEERKLNMASMDVFSRLMMDRIIYLGTEINSDVANIINAQLLFLESTNDSDITLYINSPGGSVYDGMAIYDVIKIIKPQVSTVCIGTAASMGAVLLGSGEKGKRLSLKHSKIMIHQPSGGTGRTTAADMEIAWKEMDKCRKMLYECMAEDTNKTYEEIAAACDRDHWMTSIEAKEFGLIDALVEKK